MGCRRQRVAKSSGLGTNCIPKTLPSATKNHVYDKERRPIVHISAKMSTKLDLDSLDYEIFMM